MFIVIFIINYCLILFGFWLVVFNENLGNYSKQLKWASIIMTGACVVSFVCILINFTYDDGSSLKIATLECTIAGGDHVETGKTTYECWNKETGKRIFY
jgi:amino acid transporter